MTSARQLLGFHEDVRALMGLPPKAKLPAEGMAPREINGYVVWVVPQTELLTGRKLKRSTHRMMAQCPGCHAVVSVGRLHQHYCTRFIKGQAVRPCVVMALRRLANVSIKLADTQAGTWVALYDAAFDLHINRKAGDHA